MEKMEIYHVDVWKNEEHTQKRLWTINSLNLFRWPTLATVKSTNIKFHNSLCSLFLPFDWLPGLVFQSVLFVAVDHHLSFPAVCNRLILLLALFSPLCFFWRQWDVYGKYNFSIMRDVEYLELFQKWALPEHISNYTVENKCSKILAAFRCHEILRILILLINDRRAHSVAPSTLQQMQIQVRHTS